MKRFGFLFCVLVAVAMIAGCSSVKKGKTLVEINGEKITEGDIEFLGTINPRIQMQISNPEGKKKLLENIVEQELLYQEASKKGINRKADVKAKIDLYRKVIIAQALIDNEIEESAKKYYDEHTNEFQKLKLSHIEIDYANTSSEPKGKDKKAKKPEKSSARDEAAALKLANEIKTKLDGGADFTTLAKDFSDDATTKNRGGDLGPASKADPRFESRGFGPLVEKAFEMKVGEFSAPIKTNKGYHIITVTQAVELEPFEQAKNTIISKIRNQAKDDLLKKLKENSKITYADEKKEKEQTETPEAKTPEKPKSAEVGAPPVTATEKSKEEEQKKAEPVEKKK